MKIILDAGHGKGSNFNRGSKIGNEGDNNFKFSLYLKKELEKYNIEVGLTRPNEDIGDDDDLYRRGSLGAGYDLFLSLHTNAGGGKGVEIFNSVNKGNSILADKLCKVLASVQNIPNRGVKYKYWGDDDWYGVLRFNRAKAGMLIEHCFHDNYDECKWYAENMETIAKAEAKCIAEHYGLSSIGGWKHNEVGWWYENDDGSYTTNNWQYIAGFWYYFNKNGYAYQNQWLKYQNKWYYFGNDCKMVANGWKQLSDKWYYFDKWGGAIQNNWLKYKDEWYYFDNNCYMISEKFINIGNETFYIDNWGVCELNYVREIDGKLYAFDGRGALIKDKVISSEGVIEEKEKK